MAIFNESTMDMLKFMTAGSVDDGKSTLIGKLLYDSKKILVDQMDSLTRQSKNSPHGEIDLASLTDGLRAEREQGITIDIAYRYFSTSRRKFIIADAPGHVQYTRNMVTGASNISLIIILIDAQHGIVEQTRRHSIIASILKIPCIHIAINKMDKVNYSQSVFNSIVMEYSILAKKLNLKNITYMPISALMGDNIVDPSDNMKWYNEKPLIQFLEEVSIPDENTEIARFQIQYVIRSQKETTHNYRGYSGKIALGKYRKGDNVVVLPANIKTKITKIEIAGGIEVEEATGSQSIVIQLADNIDIGRGDMIAKIGDLPKIATEVDALICWMDEQPMVTNKKYYIQHHQRLVRCIVKNISYKIDVNTLAHSTADGVVNLNDIAKVTLKVAASLVYDSYAKSRSTGSAILVDEATNNTVGAVFLI